MKHISVSLLLFFVLVGMGMESTFAHRKSPWKEKKVKQRKQRILNAETLANGDSSVIPDVDEGYDDIEEAPSNDLESRLNAFLSQNEKKSKSQKKSQQKTRPRESRKKSSKKHTITMESLETLSDEAILNAVLDGTIFDVFETPQFQGKLAEIMKSILSAIINLVDGPELEEVLNVNTVKTFVDTSMQQFPDIWGSMTGQVDEIMNSPMMQSDSLLKQTLKTILQQLISTVDDVVYSIVSTISSMKQGFFLDDSQKAQAVEIFRALSKLSDEDEFVKRWLDLVRNLLDDPEVMDHLKGLIDEYKLDEAVGISKSLLTSKSFLLTKLEEVGEFYLQNTKDGSHRVM